MEIKFVPKACSNQTDAKGEVVPATLSGFVTVTALPYPDRMRLKAEFARLQSSNEMTPDVLNNRMLMIAKMAETLKPNVISAELKDLASGREAKTADDLYDDPAFDEVVSELVVAFVMGMRPN